MVPEINLVAQSGIVKWPSLKYNAKGSPEFRFTLAKSGPYPWSIPCCAVGHTAEKLAGDLDEGMPVLISAAELCYRKRATKSGEVSRMEILVWHAQAGQVDPSGVDADSHELSPEYGSGSDHGALIVEPASAPEPKKARKPSRTRASMLAWDPRVN